MKKLFALLCCFPCLINGQEIKERSQTKIQTYTPSKLLSRGQWDVKWFNNLYTETKRKNDHRVTEYFSRQNFFTSSLDIFTGISSSNQFNIGLLVDFRSNTIMEDNILAPFSTGEKTHKRSELSSIAPAIKFNPSKKWSNFTIQTSFSIPLFSKEVENGIYLDQKGYTFQNRLFYDYAASNGVVQIYSELNTELNFGKDAMSFANDSFRLTPGVFLSYFPSPNITLLGLVQHSQLINLKNSINQRYTALGTGAKFQLNRVLILELIYTKFIWGKSSGLGQTFNLGIRGLFN